MGQGGEVLPKVPPEPKDVIDSVLDEKIVFAPDFSAKSMMVYIPRPIVNVVGRTWIYRQAELNYHRSFTDWASRVSEWENSISLRLPAAESYPDPRLSKLKEAILEIYGRTAATRQKKASKSPRELMYRRQCRLKRSLAEDLGLRSIRAEDLSFDFFALETRLEISDAVLGHVGRAEIEKIAARLFQKVLPLWKGRKIEWLPGVNSYALVLPPIPPAQRETAEKVLRQRIHDAYEGK